MVRVHPDDVSLLREEADRSGWRIIPDPGIPGGLRMELRGGKIVLANTLESRLEKGWPAWLPEIRRILLDCTMAYAYLNARLRAISGEILPSGKILDLSGLESLDDLSAGLEPAGYRFPPAEGFAPLQRVEAGIRERYAHRVARVRAMARGAGRSAELLIRGAIHRWDLHTLKTLLRGRIRRESAEETAAWTVPG
ncbi:MAG: V-type ATPase subunit, partial [Candidatus Riflebacteria bacterium]|nr:V-type ATPase subunit [Candidatus Riflebacteria bacterium]